MGGAAAAGCAHYVIDAHFDLTEQAAEGDNAGKFQDIIKRRIKRGQFYHQPYFGCREFPAQFKACEAQPPCPEELKGEWGKKKVLLPRHVSLPAPVKRSSGVASNFLWDNSSYILGVDEKGKPQRSLECFAACKALHHKLLDGVDSPAARAVLAFFDCWNPSQAREHPALSDKLADILSSANLVFRYDGAFVQDVPLIRAAWQSSYDATGDGPELVCLVTGQKGAAEPVHPAIKGIAGAQSSGAALVSFNGAAFCSYGREQSLNARSANMLPLPIPAH